jgi:hypothetical protein
MDLANMNIMSISFHIFGSPLITLLNIILCTLSVENLLYLLFDGFDTVYPELYACCSYYPEQSPPLVSTHSSFALKEVCPNLPETPVILATRRQRSGGLQFEASAGK